MIIGVWINEMGSLATYMDAAFLIIAAALYNIEILVFVVDDNGNKACPPQLFSPASGQPARRIELVCHAEKHFALVLLDSSTEQTASDDDDEQLTPEEVGGCDDDSELEDAHYADWGSVTGGGQDSNDEADSGSHESHYCNLEALNTSLPTSPTSAKSEATATPPSLAETPTTGGYASGSERTPPTTPPPTPSPSSRPSGTPSPVQRMRQPSAACAVQVPSHADQEAQEPARASPAVTNIDVRKAAAASFILIILASASMAARLRPVIYAHVNGFTVLGAWQPEPQTRTEATKTAQQLSDAVTHSRAISTLVGEYEGGARLCVTPTTLPANQVICTTTTSRLTWLARGATFMWCSLAAIAGTPCADAAQRATLAMQAYVAPVRRLADNADGGQAFRIGAATAAFVTKLADVPSLTYKHTLCRLTKARADDNRLAQHIDESNADALLDGWAEAIKPMPVEEIPQHLLCHPPSFADSTLDTLPFAPIIKPLITPWLPLPPPQEPAPAGAPACVRSPWDLFTPAGAHRARYWFNWSLRDMASVNRQLEAGVAPAAVTRDRPPPIAIGQAALHSWARGRVWDCRRTRTHCCVIADFTTPIQSGINLDLLRRRLASYPDRSLLSHLLEGVRLEADVELQTVLVPHLMSLPAGFGAVGNELQRMHQMGWYEFYDEPAFIPSYFNGQGSTPRPLEPGRDRRTTEGGGPRREVLDETGLRALPLNEAAKGYHLPRHFTQDRRIAMQCWLAARGLPRPAAEPPLPAGRSKWPKECKPLLVHVLRDLAILRRAAEALSQPIYVFSDDFADHFSQLAFAESELGKVNIHFINYTHLLRAHGRPHANDAGHVFVVEKRLGFGMHGASNVAQRFSDALLHLFRLDMDAADDLAPRTEAEWRWHAAREEACRAAAARDQPAGGGDQPSAGGEHEDRRCVQHRLYSCSLYTDDALCIVVGAQRATRALRIWRQLVRDLGLLMAKPQKRHLGAYALWLGVLIIAPLGICVVPKQKLLRAGRAIDTALANEATFASYRSLCGLLEHLRAVTVKGRNTMFGLYEPHGPEGASREGPDGIVRCSLLMRKQLLRWKAALIDAGGVSARATILRREVVPPAQLIIALCSDACLGDEDTPGMGGYCQGFYWYFAVPEQHIDLVNTPLLEFLAVCGNILTFFPYLAPFLQANFTAVLRTDALTTALCLPRESQQSKLLQRAFEGLRGCSEFARLRGSLQVCHIYGDTNALSDRVSRARWNEFYELCKQLRVRQEQLPTPPSFTNLYLQVVRYSAHLRRVSGGSAAASAQAPAAARAERPVHSTQPVSHTYHVHARHDANRNQLVTHERREVVAPDGEPSGACPPLNHVRLHMHPHQCADAPILQVDGTHTRNDDDQKTQPRITYVISASRDYVLRTPKRSRARNATGAAAATRGSGRAGDATAALNHMQRQLAPSSGAAQDSAATTALSAGTRASAQPRRSATRAGSSSTRTLVGAAAAAASAIHYVNNSSTARDGDFISPTSSSRGINQLPYGSGCRSASANEHLALVTGGCATASANIPEQPASSQAAVAAESSGLVAALRKSAKKATPAVSNNRKPRTTTAHVHKIPTASKLQRRQACDKSEAPSALAAAAACAARNRAATLVEGGEPEMQIGAPSHLVAAVVNAADNCTEIGVNPATAAKDERAWALWSRMCTHLNTSAVRTAQDVRDFPGRITFLLTSLMLYARMWCVPKQPGQPNIRPKSCLAYPLAIIRIYKRWGIALPGYKQLCACLQGMCRAYVNHHGPGSLTPRKAEPFRFEMARAIYDLPDGTNIGKLRWLYDSQDVFIF